MTMTNEPETRPMEEILERETELPTIETLARIRWIEWMMLLVVVAVLAIGITALVTSPEADWTGPVPDHLVERYAVPDHLVTGLVFEEAGSPLALGARHLTGVAFVPEYVGHADGVYPEAAMYPEFTLVIGPRNLDGVVFVPEYVGHADGIFPESTR